MLRECHGRAGEATPIVVTTRPHGVPNHRRPPRRPRWWSTRQRRRHDWWCRATEDEAISRGAPPGARTHHAPITGTTRAIGRFTGLPTFRRAAVRSAPSFDTVNRTERRVSM